MMIIKKHVERRTFIRGAGTVLALPLLDCMVPALTAQGRTAAAPKKRFGAVYVPNGIVMPQWTPAVEGTDFELPPILTPLAPFRDYLTVLTGLSSKAGAAGAHAYASTKFLTDTAPKHTQASQVEAGISMDQLVARELGKSTQLASLELGLEPAEHAGTCGDNLSCAYSNTIAWRSPTVPLPMEPNPRAVFERLFGDNESTDPVARLHRLEENRSLLDSVSQKLAGFRRGLGGADRARLDEFVDAVRDIERRIQMAESQAPVELPLMTPPAGIPATFEEHATLMFDLQLLAYQCDLTRVTTFMIGHELSGRTYPEIGVPDAHHPTSHHGNNPENLAKLTKINTYHMQLFANYIKKLQSTADGDGSLLDHTIIVYGSGMSDGHDHAQDNLPMVLVGGGTGTMKGNRHITYPADTPLANLHLTVLDKLGVAVDRIGNSSGTLKELAMV